MYEVEGEGAKVKDCRVAWEGGRLTTGNVMKYLRVI